MSEINKLRDVRVGDVVEVKTFSSNQEFWTIGQVMTVGVQWVDDCAVGPGDCVGVQVQVLPEHIGENGDGRFDMISPERCSGAGPFTVYLPVSYIRKPEVNYEVVVVYELYELTPEGKCLYNGYESYTDMADDAQILKDEGKEIEMVRTLQLRYLSSPEPYYQEIATESLNKDNHLKTGEIAVTQIVNSQVGIDPDIQSAI